MMLIEQGKVYMLYGKMGKMKRFKPVSGSGFAENRIHGELYAPESTDDIQRLEKELKFLNEQGKFELRETN